MCIALLVLVKFVWDSFTWPPKASIVPAPVKVLMFLCQRGDGCQGMLPGRPLILLSSDLPLSFKHLLYKLGIGFKFSREIFLSNNSELDRK